MTFALWLLGIALMVAVALVALTAVVARKAETAVPPIGRFAEVDGRRLHYVDEGAGPAILMIHGLGSQLQTFTHSLTPLLRGYRLVAVDRPGAGYSQAAPAATLTAQADIIARFLDMRGIDRALVVGHSLGGAVALALAIDHPDRVAGLALLAPASQPQDDPPAVLRLMAIRTRLVRWLVGWLLVTPINLIAGGKTLAAVFAPDAVPSDFATRAGGLLQIRPGAFRNASRDLVEAGEQLAAYAERQGFITAPVGVLYGTADNLLDHRLHGDGLVSRIESAELELIVGAGHMLPISDPERCAALIERVAAKAFAAEAAA